jgi:phosphoglycerol transferase MdoB-like AlkP superfamily enzyme
MTSKNSNSGLSLPGVLFIIFLILKLTGNIDWSWWWVTSPLWMPILVFIGLVFVFIGIVLVALAFGASMEDIKLKSKEISNKYKQKSK